MTLFSSCTVPGSKPRKKCDCYLSYILYFSADDDLHDLRSYSTMRDHSQDMYLKACAKLNVSPAAHFIKALKTERATLNHRQLGAPGIKAICIALVVSIMGFLSSDYM